MEQLFIKFNYQVERMFWYFITSPEGGDGTSDSQWKQTESRSDSKWKKADSKIVYTFMHTAR